MLTKLSSKVLDEMRVSHIIDNPLELSLNCAPYLIAKLINSNLINFLCKHKFMLKLF